MRLVLLSNSTNHGGGYLEHASYSIRALFGGGRRIAFVPFAIADQVGYWERARAGLRDLGVEVLRVEEGSAAAATIAEADGLFVGGGNTFRLLDKLQKARVLPAIRDRVRNGMPYLGSSAGTVIAAPTLQTTNDMPISQPGSFRSLGLVPFQINCHYLDADPGSTHMGETREDRLIEYHEENHAPVVGLREGSWLEVEAPGPRATASVTLCGPKTARLFRRGIEPVEVPPGVVPYTLLKP
jgi:dipeptidase E